MSEKKEVNTETDVPATEGGDSEVRNESPSIQGGGETPKGGSGDAPDPTPADTVEEVETEETEEVESTEEVSEVEEKPVTTEERQEFDRLSTKRHNMPLKANEIARYNEIDRKING